MRDETQRDRLVITKCKQISSQSIFLTLIRKLLHRAGERWQRIREIVEAVDARDFFNEVNLAINVEAPGRNVHAEVGRFFGNSSVRSADANRRCFGDGNGGGGSSGGYAE